MVAKCGGFFTLKPRHRIFERASYLFFSSGLLRQFWLILKKGGEKWETSLRPSDKKQESSSAKSVPFPLIEVTSLVKKNTTFRSSFLSILEVVDQLKVKYPGFGLRFNEAKAFGRWEKAVGPLIAKHSRAIKVVDSVLWVEVKHNIWQAELHYRKAQILAILNQINDNDDTQPPPDGNTRGGSSSKQTTAKTAQDLQKAVIQDLRIINPYEPVRYGFQSAKEPKKPAPNK